MATLNPFCGLRYDPAIVGDLGAVVAPPYDVIDDAGRAQLYARSDFNARRSRVRIPRFRARRTRSCLCAFNVFL